MTKNAPIPQIPVDGRDIMVAVSLGTPGAFDLLVKTYEARIKAGVRRHIADRRAVEDLSQEVLLRLYRSRARYKPTARFETFLYRIILNLCVNHTQYSRRRRVLPLDHNDDVKPGDGVSLVDTAAHSPMDMAIVSEHSAMVRQAVERLPEAQRRAVILSRFSGLGYGEVADQLGMSPGAVKSMLWRARANLRTSLQPCLAADFGG